MEPLSNDLDEPPMEVSYNYAPVKTGVAQSSESSFSSISPLRTPKRRGARQENVLGRSSISPIKVPHHFYSAKYSPLPLSSPSRILPPKLSEIELKPPLPFHPFQGEVLGSETGLNQKGGKGSSNLSLVHSLKSQIFTLRQHVEELRSSESLIVGEQKMLIQQLQAVEPKRVKLLSQELDSFKGNFATLLEDQIEKIAEMQLGLNEVRRGCEGFSILKDDVSEVVDYESEILMSKKNISLLKSILERRTSALADEVDKLLKSEGIKVCKEKKMNLDKKGIDKHISTIYEDVQVKDMPPHVDTRTLAPVNESDVKPTRHEKETSHKKGEDFVSKDEREIGRRRSSEDTLNGFFQLEDPSTGGYETRALGNDGDIEIKTGDEEEESILPQLGVLEHLQRQIDTLQKEKEGEIGELRCALAHQNHVFSTRVVEIQMKIENYYFQQIRRHKIHDSRINYLEQDHRFPRKLMNPTFLDRSINTPRHSMGSPFAFGAKATDVVRHDNLSVEGFSASITEDVSDEVRIESQLSGSESSNIANQRTTDTTTTISAGESHQSMESLLADKDNEIERLQNQLAEAKRVIEDIELTLKTYNCNDECQPLLSSGIKGINPTESTQQKNLSWVKRRIAVLRRKNGGNKRKKSNIKYGHVSK